MRNARDLEWTANEMGAYCDLLQGGDDAAEEFAINLNVLPQGAPMALYHHEPHQEGFLVLRGECRARRRRARSIPLRSGTTSTARRACRTSSSARATSRALVLAVGSRVGGGGATYPERSRPARCLRGVRRAARRWQSPL